MRDSSQKKRERGDKAPRAKGIPLIGFLLDGHVGGGGVGGGGDGGGVAAADEGVAVAVAAKDRAIADIITFLVAGHRQRPPPRHLDHRERDGEPHQHVVERQVVHEQHDVNA